MAAFTEPDVLTGLPLNPCGPGSPGGPGGPGGPGMLWPPE